MSEQNTGEIEVARYLANARKLEDGHAYSPDQEHDACGVGFVAAINGKPRREVVARAIDALKAVWHRGAVDADGKTGDGCGIHLQVPQDFFREQVQQTGHKLRSGRTERLCDFDTTCRGPNAPTSCRGVHADRAGSDCRPGPQ